MVVMVYMQIQPIANTYFMTNFPFPFCPPAQAGLYSHHVLTDHISYNPI